MKKQYRYKNCSRCKKLKDENRNPYCRECSRSYGKRYRLIKKLRPNVNIEGLGSFIAKVKKDNLVDLSDMNIIIFFYEIITDNINEYDDFNSGKQLTLMWERINEYYNKKTSSKK